MKRISMIGIALAGALAFAPSAALAGPVYDSAPADGWLYGSGNNYSPSNTAVLTTDAGDQLYLRLHNTGHVAPLSDGSVYSFALGTTPISFDWGIDSSGSGSFDGVTALLTLTNLGTGASVSYDPFATPDNTFGSGSVQNSARLNFAFLSGLGFDASVNDTYRVSLSVSGLEGGSRSLTVDARMGDGAAVPEPTSWATMVGGFGLVGGAMRRRKVKAALA